MHTNTTLVLTSQTETESALKIAQYLTSTTPDGKLRGGRYLYLYLCELLKGLIYVLFD